MQLKLLIGLWALTSMLAHAGIDQDASFEVNGLSQPAEILVDEWGVPHIFAADHYDVFFVQGFNAARDRLWQIDLWRRRGLGELSSVLGAAYIEQDKAARLFMYRGDMYAEWLAYGNDAKRITKAFVQGINAYVDAVNRNPHLLPPEFEMLGYSPAKWRAEDLVRIRSNGLWRNVTMEVWRAQLACSNNLELAAQWKVLEPNWTTSIPDGLDPCDVPNDVLDTYRLAKAPVKFEEFGITESAASTIDDFQLDIGSNNWVVAPERTATGRPILADDPHRGHAVPSLRYISHLVGPGINAIGAGEPALPGISIGHNDRIAFGLTIFPIDQEDLYVYRKKRRGYQYQGRREPFILINETIEVKDASPIPVQLKFTRHGPVVAETRRHAFAVRAAWLEPGMAPYFGSIEYMRAKGFRTFSAALNRWGAPSENQVYADIDGNIGYMPAGRFPKRDNWDGLLPVPGDGRYEWNGYFDMDVLPKEYNPARGFSGTANSMNLPDGYPINTYRIGFEWSAPWRYKRLWETLQRDSQHTLQSSSNLQRDYHSVLARQVIHALPDLSKHGGPLLASWDFVLAPDSAPAALWGNWYFRHLVPSLQALIDPQDIRPAGSPPLDSKTVLQLLTTDAGRQIAYASLEPARQEISELLGPDPTKWAWGDLHKIEFTHPLIELADDAFRAQLELPSYPRGGSGNTTNNTSFSATNYSIRSGASFRMVVDVGNWDAAEMTNAPGQSGDPRSRFYNNLLEGWAADDSFPLLYSRAAIEQHVAFRISLLPKKENSDPTR